MQSLLHIKRCVLPQVCFATVVAPQPPVTTHVLRVHRWQVHALQQQSRLWGSRWCVRLSRCNSLLRKRLRGHYGATHGAVPAWLAGGLGAWPQARSHFQNAVVRGVITHEVQERHSIELLWAKNTSAFP